MNPILPWEIWGIGIFCFACNLFSLWKVGIFKDLMLEGAIFGVIVFWPIALPIFSCVPVYDAIFENE